ncbi:MAG TPA: tetratricopeptide repeat protein [Holophagaceae bacterium]|nr:tetratricopeptide repeat protein [Holophagaceae bacterium]
MRDLPPPVRRALGILGLGLPVLGLLGPFPILRWTMVLGLLGLACLLLLLPATGLQEDLAWRVLFGLLSPVAWVAPDPGPWWTALARRSEDTRLIEGALLRGEAWGDAEASLEIALNHLGSGVPGIQQAGLAQLQALGARGHREALEALAGCMAWGLGTPLDPARARALWSRLAHPVDDPIPLPRPGLFRSVAARPQGGLEGGLGAALDEAGEATRGLLQRSALARAGLWIAAIVIALLLLALPFTFLLTALVMNGPVRLAAILVLYVVAGTATPLLLLLVVMTVNQRLSTRMGRAERALRLRAEAGDAEACFHLGQAFDRGTPHTPRDHAEARRWYQAAADRGHVEGAFHLGELLLVGVGGLRDRSGALTWLQRAADRGHEGAARFLAQAQPPSEDA